MEFENTSLKGKKTYLDKYKKFSFPYNIIFFIFMVIFVDTLITYFVTQQLIDMNITSIIAYASRLASIFFIFYAFRWFYYYLKDIIFDFMTRFEEDTYLILDFKKLDKKLDYMINIKLHLLCGIISNIGYLIILFSYIFPVLKWGTYHPVSNLLWVGAIGIGLYAVFFGFLMIINLSRNIKIHKAIEPLHFDETGGLSKVGKITYRFVAFYIIAFSLSIGSVRPAINIFSIFLLFNIVILFGTALLIMIFYNLHNTLKFLKNDFKKEFLQLYNKAYEERSDSLTLNDKLDLIHNLFLVNISLNNINTLKLWPISYDVIIDIIGILLGFLPIISQLTFI